MSVTNSAARSDISRTFPSPSAAGHRGEEAEDHRSEVPQRSLDPDLCESYFSGHTVHPIQAIRSVLQPHDTGTLISVEETLITVDFAGERRQWRNHAPEILLERIGIGGQVRVCEPWFILSYSPPGDLPGHAFVLSIRSIHTPWRPCIYEPLEASSFDDLAEGVTSHGGFTIPGQTATGWITTEE